MNCARFEKKIRSAYVMYGGKYNAKPLCEDCYYLLDERRKKCQINRTNAKELLNI